MDVYGGGVSASSELYPIEELLDLSLDEEEPVFFTSNNYNHLSTTSSSSSLHFGTATPNPTIYFTEFTPDLCVPPSDDVAELEWLSNFVHNDSYYQYTAAAAAAAANNNNNKRESSSSSFVGRRCTHCATEKTPQWRTGPSGPKTLCNACGVRYKSGRLVPEYRPAASPSFVLTQHSNSHRKVMELRRQKQQQQQEEDQHQHQQQINNTTTIPPPMIISSSSNYRAILR